MIVLGSLLMLSCSPDQADKEPSVGEESSQTSSPQALTQAQLDTFAAGASLRFAVVSNLDPAGPKAKLILENPTEVDLPAGEGDWAIYIHSIRKIPDTQQVGLKVSHVQGDLHRLVPTSDFPGLAQGSQLEFTYSLSSHMVSYTDFMPRAFIHHIGREPVVFANTDTENIRQFVEPIVGDEQLLRSNSDATPPATADSRYSSNEAVNSVALDASEWTQRIIPRPLAAEVKGGSTTLNGDWQILYAESLSGEAAYLQARLQEVQGVQLSSAQESASTDERVIRITLDAGDSALPAAAESYTLHIEQDAIIINGRDRAGAFYGVQSLLNLLPAQIEGSYELPQMSLVDSPRLRWRGMHYDMARNFHGKEVTLRLIEQMARYKMNRLHLHLTEDEGWRLEIPGLPELTNIGAHRCFDLSERHCLLTQLGTGPHVSGSGNGYYSRADFIEILEYAAARHIEVIPEIDVPGHARAAVKAMEARYARLMEEERAAEAEQYLLSDPDDTSQYLTVQNYTDNSLNVCMESSYTFLEKVMVELQAMYREAGQTLTTFHVGGDEVGEGSWAKSPKCAELIQNDPDMDSVADLKPYFVRRAAALADQHGLALVGWEDGLMDTNTDQPFERAQFKNERMLVNPWDNIWEWGAGDRAYRFANAGYEVILSHATHLYFDHPHEPHPQERGYYWATRYTNAEQVFGYMPDDVYANATTTRDGAPIDDLEALVGRPMVALEKPENILGMQGQVWSETIRTAEQLEAMLYPRLIAAAERAWHKAPWEGAAPDAAARNRDFISFARALVERELPKLEAAGVTVHLLPPGARIKNGVLHANADLPGVTIQVSTDDQQSWWTYHEPVEVEADSVYLRSRQGNHVSRITRLD